MRTRFVSFTPSNRVAKETRAPGVRFDEVFQFAISLAFRAPIPRVGDHLDPLSRSSVRKDDVPFGEPVVRDVEQVLQDAGPRAVDDKRGLDAGSRGRMWVRQELRLD